MVNIQSLESKVRDDLNAKCPRRMGVNNDNPIKVILDKDYGLVDCKNYPQIKENNETRQLMLGNSVWINNDDFSTNPPRGYKRLVPGGMIRLKYGHIFQYTNHTVDDETGMTHICLSLVDTEKLSKKQIKKIGTITWVPCDINYYQKCVVREYDHLFPHTFDTSGSIKWEDQLNPKSLRIKEFLIESNITMDQVGKSYQFERMGYYCVDKDSDESKMVINQIIPLKEAKDIVKQSLN
jgi:glutaminyl-tRNA synthetase